MLETIWMQAAHRCWRAAVASFCASDFFATVVRRRDRVMPAEAKNTPAAFWK